MRVRWLAVLSCLFAAFALALAACGDDDEESVGGGDEGGGGISGDTLTIYSSLPLQGTSKGQSEAVINGEKLALKEVSGKVGKYKIDYVSLDDSTAPATRACAPSRPRSTAARSTTSRTSSATSPRASRTRSCS